MDDDTYTLGELADVADVSTRTIRYYIAEGLLPPPEGHGHASRYTGEHLTRLRRIAALKAQYLPLREIRNRLGDPAPPPLEDPRSSRAGARGYLQTLRRASAPPSRLVHEEAAGAAFDLREPTAAPTPAPLMAPPPAMSFPGAERGEGTRPPDELAEDLAPPGRVWRRIPIGASAELVIADDLYRRRRDKVDWLVRWARKVLDG